VCLIVEAVVLDEVQQIIRVLGTQECTSQAVPAAHGHNEASNVLYTFSAPAFSVYPYPVTDQSHCALLESSEHNCSKDIST
jgi:hypothetical protein